MQHIIYRRGTSKDKRKCIICKCGTLKAKSDGGFADEEKARVKGNMLSASAERKKQNAMTGLQMQNNQEQKEMYYLQAWNIESKMRW